MQVRVPWSKVPAMAGELVSHPMAVGPAHSSSIFYVLRAQVGSQEMKLQYRVSLAQRAKD